MAVSKKTWDHKLRDTVSFGWSTAVVIGRAHFVDSNPKYLIRYVANKVYHEQWIDESALAPATTSPTPDPDEQE